MVTPCRWASRRPAAGVAGNLLAYAGVLGREKQVLDAHRFAHGQLGGQLVDARGPPQVGVAAEHQRAETVVGQPLLEGCHLIGLGRAEEHVVHPQRGQMRPGVVLILAVVHMRIASGLVRGRLGRFAPRM